MSGLVAALACGSSSTTSTSPTPAKCQVALSLPNGTVEASGGGRNLTIGTSAECAWSAVSSVNWITGLSPQTGQGSGEMQFQVAPNPTATARQGEIRLNDVTARVSQVAAGCRVELDPPSPWFDSGPALAGVTVRSPGGCPWTATSNAAWIAITAGATGSGDGTFRYSLSSNGGASRVGTVSVADQTLVISQAAPAVALCVYTLQTGSASMAAAGGTTGVSVQTAPGCSWTAASNASWLAVAGVASGSGSGTVTVSAAQNTGAARAGTLTIAGQTFTVNQAGVTQSCNVTLQPTSHTLDEDAQTAPNITVSVGAGCTWTAVETVDWITILSGASGTGNGTVR